MLNLSKIRFSSILVLMLLGCSMLFSQEAGKAVSSSIASNGRLKQLFELDQADRIGKQLDEATSKRDKERREEVTQLLELGLVRTADDYFHAAMVFQHGETADEIRTAFSLAWIASQFDTQYRARLQWLSAAAWDRIMMREKMPQWYGTQYVMDNPEDGFRLYKVDETAVTDEQRAALGLPLLDEAKQRVEHLNERMKPDSQTDDM